MYKIMYNKIGRCNVAHRLRLYLHACFSGASIPSVPGPCSIHRKARASTLCRHGNSLGAFIGGSSLSRRYLTLMAAGHASGWPILRGGAQ